MSSVPAQKPIVTRSYSPAADRCASALELLLKEPISKVGGPATAPDSAKGGSKNDSSATKNSTR
jgi:hypothetical protein